jgi:hypothetical protein
VKKASSGQSIATKNKFQQNITPKEEGKKRTLKAPRKEHNQKAQRGKTNHTPATTKCNKPHPSHNKVQQTTKKVVHK